MKYFIYLLAATSCILFLLLLHLENSKFQKEVRIIRIIINIVRNNGSGTLMLSLCSFVESGRKIEWCHENGLWANSNRSKVALASFPGSGNTWMRYLLQQSTGEHACHMHI